ncbi:MAG TPA: DNA polymerase III subunit gamma and tau, partial [Microbacterium sp.]|nr:DNA polymerase III subunit gamma and tau [Microbacterium sp.]
AAPSASAAPAASPAPAPAPAASPHPVASPQPVAEPVEAQPGPTPAPSGPVTLQHVRDAWPEVLARLEDISRGSWLVASNARVLAFAGDVLTLAFQSQSDVAKFKKLTAGQGVSEDLRNAILGVLGVRVKYLARHDSDASDAPGPDALPPDAPSPDAPPSNAPPPDDDPGESPGGASDSSSRPRTVVEPPHQGRPQPATSPRAASVTEWAVAPIPTEGDGTAFPHAGTPIAVAQFPVDDEPEEAESAPTVLRVATLAPEREGDVLADDIEPPSDEDDDDEPDVDTLGPAVAMPAVPNIAPKPNPRSTGVQRYGEPVVRQVLGGRFIREEPYEPPTRFS